ncbi:hypothetical protein LI140_15380 [Phocaeicola dorei]|uniref:Uncharacterized protein n=2 Tax=Phocaeicola dorei TaxID=357276 RepID=A0A413GC04_9BACT|nr:hypothetical protein [Phocaeicola dorei]EEB23471.1 hypothetical protein BACDOR_03923 [Phocaeicola dorei DSM 17855]KAA3161415.1 hypothetical protein F2A23_13860 [Akkermansia sp. BIOML-A63]RGL95545.1 hypothetical protein DXC38_18745 [Bacteroides sp. 3_1_33FAA]RJV35655.1 hypothetical protein DWY42_22780 [Bacteroides sp. AF25-18]MBS4962818.1 hypothetical protein [Phocaeicola dorei]
MPTPSRAADGWRNGLSVGVSVRHTFIRSYRRTDGKGLFPDRKGEIIRWGYTGKQAAGRATAERPPTRRRVFTEKIP